MKCRQRPKLTSHAARTPPDVLEDTRVKELRVERASPTIDDNVGYMRRRRISGIPHIKSMSPTGHTRPAQSRHMLGQRRGWGWRGKLTPSRVEVNKDEKERTMGSGKEDESCEEIKRNLLAKVSHVSNLFNPYSLHIHDAGYVANEGNTYMISAVHGKVSVLGVSGFVLVGEGGGLEPELPPPPSSLGKGPDANYREEQCQLRYNHTVLVPFLCKGWSRLKRSGRQISVKQGEYGETSRGAGEISEKTRCPAASYATTPKCENPGATPLGIEPSSPRSELSNLTITPLRLPTFTKLKIRRGEGVRGVMARIPRNHLSTGRGPITTARPAAATEMSFPARWASPSCLLRMRAPLLRHGQPPAAVHKALEEIREFSGVVVNTPTRKLGDNEWCFALNIAACIGIRGVGRRHGKGVLKELHTRVVDKSLREGTEQPTGQNRDRDYVIRCENIAKPADRLRPHHRHNFPLLLTGLLFARDKRWEHKTTK
ncbi:hypothetical protein PR048_007910 [Dryococelus australis]|uniref:Uncharacterized protein n=1 Tax=Dryococelus australis TaxID=614101 RepID=A0ABQ9HVL4_9NEOP|nr:hypothetical protein PR048_007910 [Dryococelus australis]